MTWMIQNLPPSNKIQDFSAIAIAGVAWHRWKTCFSCRIWSTTSSKKWHFTRGYLPKQTSPNLICPITMTKTEMHTADLFGLIAKIFGVGSTWPSFWTPRKAIWQNTQLTRNNVEQKNFMYYIQKKLLLELEFFPRSLYLKMFNNI
jgi:hypothetical protein